MVIKLSRQKESKKKVDDYALFGYDTEFLGSRPVQYTGSLIAARRANVAILRAQLRH
jgi:hypothetical protein